MIEIQIPDEVLKKASERADAQSNNIFSFTTTGKLYGLIAEELFLNKYGGELKNTKHYDIEINGLKLDLKAKSCKGLPEPHYSASVSDYQKGHKSDGYIFYRVRKDLKVAWELGGFLKDDFFQKATFIPAGSRDGPFICKVNMWNVPISDLKSVEDILNEVNGP